MYQLLDGAERIIGRLRGCFSREASFRWFETLVLGLMLRPDRLGVTSAVRALSLRGESYASLLGALRSSAWCAAGLREAWCRAVAAEAPLLRVLGRPVLCADGVKAAAAGLRQPGVKRLHREPSASEGEGYFPGRLYGAVGVLAGEPGAAQCVPLKVNLQDGMRAAAGWEGAGALGVSAASHVVQSVECASEAAAALGEACYLAMDRYFLAAPALRRLAELEEAGGPSLELVTRARSGCAAWEEPPAACPGRPGRPRKVGARVRLRDLFATERFEPARVAAAGGARDVELACRDLLWGRGLYRKMRFVLVRRPGEASGEVLATTDLSLEPARVVELYSLRWGVECAFRDMKQELAGLSCRFWTAALPKRDPFARRDGDGRLEAISDPGDRALVLSCHDATERYVACACVALGVLQILSLSGAGALAAACEYRRTPRRAKVSVRTVRSCMRSGVLRFILSRADSPMASFIRERLVGEGGYDPGGGGAGGGRAA